MILACELAVLRVDSPAAARTPYHLQPVFRVAPHVRDRHLPRSSLSQGGRPARHDAVFPGKGGFFLSLQVQGT